MVLAILWRLGLVLLIAILMGSAWGFFLVRWEGRPVEVREGRIYAKPTGLLAQNADAYLGALESLFYFLEFGPYTHPWNNTKLRPDEVAHLNPNMMILSEGIPGETTQYPFTHIPLLGGWRRTVVFSPTDPTEPWFPIWKNPDGQEIKFAGMSRIPCWGPSQLRRGRGSALLGAVSAVHGRQLPVREVARRYIGDRTIYSRIPTR